MFKLITEKKDWNGVLDFYKEFDFYHTYDYHHISKKIGEEPILIQYSQGDKSIALPLLLRKIKGTDYKDATSVYGYAGPLSYNIDEKFDNRAFREQLHDLFKGLKIVSVFSRLHPYIPAQTNLLANIGEITNIGNIVNIDLQKDLDSQRQEYNKRLKTYINKARRSYTVFNTKKEFDILKFIELYHENMHRVNADSSYFFKRDYFFGLINSKDFKTNLILAKCNSTQEVVGGAMFIEKNNIVQYHLSGAKEGFLHLNPIKLLIDEERIRATKEKYTFFNLGGGKGGQEDSLFQFKAGFSKDLWMFSIWTYIVDQEKYDKLVSKTLQNVPKEKHKVYFEYFPHYRCIP